MGFRRLDVQADGPGQVVETALGTQRGQIGGVAHRDHEAEHVDRGERGEHDAADTEHEDRGDRQVPAPGHAPRTPKVSVQAGLPGWVRAMRSAASGLRRIDAEFAICQPAGDPGTVFLTW